MTLADVINVSRFPNVPSVLTPGEFTLSTRKYSS